MDPVPSQAGPQATQPPQSVQPVQPDVQLSREELIEIIRNSLDQDYHACDFKLGIAWAACSSLKRSSVFRPGPPSQICGSNDFLSSLSKLTLKRLYDNPNLWSKVPTQTLKILYWLFSSPGSTKVTQVRDWRRIIWPPGIPEKTLPPGNLTFKIHHSNEEETSFEKLREEFGSWKLCYHGTSLDRCYSILNRGLIPELFAGEGLFGDGAYFSTDPRVAFNFVKSGVPWPHTLLADYYGCMFVCEVIKHPSVKFSKSGPERNQMPDTYILVGDNSLIQTRYVVVFYSTSASNKYIKIVALYVCILIVVVVMRSSWFKKMVMKYQMDYLD